MQAEGQTVQKKHFWLCLLFYFLLLANSLLLFSSADAKRGNGSQAGWGLFENLSRCDNIHHSASLTWWSSSSSWQSTPLSLQHCTSLQGSKKGACIGEIWSYFLSEGMTMTTDFHPRSLNCHKTRWVTSFCHVCLTLSLNFSHRLEKCT